VLISCNGTTEETDNTEYSGIPKPTEIKYTLANTFPHDTAAYTQGLELFNGKLLESTGDFVNSSLRITEIKSGKVEKINKMGTNNIFAEGTTIFNHKIYQLTWQNNLVFVYDEQNIDNPIDTLHWPHEGWGITHNGKQLIISDGSSNLYFVDPANFKIVSILNVKDNNGPEKFLNELEYVDGFIYANVYQNEYIVKINPENGFIVGRINLSSLLQPQYKIPERTDVLNGIAYDSTLKSFYVTGKRWPKLFEIKLTP
ncbi:MAG: glutaminyl-peptide cyclotransferase, partial [Ferruginibacter sp.]|nr:glutaminyl-peptide cyclotransferase [Ferruginibacter sp.]